MTKEVYVTFYRMRRREQFLEEKDARNGKVLYCGLDTEEMLGEEMIPDRVSPDVQDAVIARLMAEKLHACLKNCRRGSGSSYMHCTLTDCLSGSILQKPGFLRRPSITEKRRRFKS